MALVILLSFLFGAIIGSFLNVLTIRYNTGKGMGGRSACMTCGVKLKWYELIPVVSYFFQGGRCTNCGSRVAWQYPAVEILTGIVFSSVFYKYWLFCQPFFDFAPETSSPNIFLFFIVVMTFISVALWLIPFSFLIFIVVYDIRHKIIPNGAGWFLIFFALAVSFLEVFLTWPHTQIPWVHLSAGPLLALPLALLWFFSRGRAMGFGDAKLALATGWLLGLAQGVSALLIAFWIGGVVSIYLLVRRKSGFSMKSEIPFAPFLVLGIFISFFFNVDLFGLETFFQK